MAKSKESPYVPLIPERCRVGLRVMWDDYRPTPVMKITLAMTQPDQVHCGWFDNQDHYQQTNLPLACLVMFKDDLG
jgi:hypothetical protein